MDRVCSKCNLSKQLEEFPLCGNGNRKGYCKSCFKKQRQEAAGRRTEGAQALRCCRLCHVSKPVSDFPNKGYGLRGTACVACSNARQREFWEENRAYLLQNRHDTVKEKRCRDCGKVLPAEEFYYNGRYRSSVCRACTLKKRKDGWIKNKEKRNKTRRGGYTPLKNKDYVLRSKYGMSLDEYNNRLVNQNSKCAICGSEDPKGKGGFVVDHCHSTGAVRGLLCSPCNLAVGLTYESVSTLEAMIRYLQKHS